MKLSLILQAVDRWSGPLGKARASTSALDKAADRATRSTTSFGRSVETARGKVSALNQAALTANRTMSAQERAFDRAYRAGHRLGRRWREMAQSDLALLRGAMSAATQQAGRLGGGMVRAGIGFAGRAAAGAAIGGAAAAAYGAGRFGAGVLETGRAFERLQAQLEGTEGSPEKAKSALQWVSKFADKTPYDLNTVAEAFTRARGVGIDPMTGAFTSLGDAAAGANKSFMQAVEAMADAQTGEFERLKEFNITSATKGANVTFSYITKAGKNASRSVKKDAKSIQLALLDIFNEKYGGGMDRLAGTLDGIISNLGDKVTKFQLMVADKGIYERVKNSLKGVLDWADRLEKEGKLEAWAQKASDKLTELWDKAEQFIKETDWASVARGIAGITSAVITLVGWLAKAVELLGKYSEFRKEAAAGMPLRGFTSFLFTPLWGKDSPYWGAPQPKKRSEPGGLQRLSDAERKAIWLRASQTPPKAQVDLNIRTPAGTSAQPARISATGIGLNVRTGPAMRGEV